MTVATLTESQSLVYEQLLHQMESHAIIKYLELQCEHVRLRTMKARKYMYQNNVNVLKIGRYIFITKGGKVVSAEQSSAVIIINETILPP